MLIADFSWKKRTQEKKNIINTKQESNNQQTKNQFANFGDFFQGID